MRTRAEFAYVQARLQARCGAAADAAAWRALDASRSAAHYLGQLRAGPLAGWAAELPAPAPPAAIELALRRAWRRRVVEIARWMPARWQAATHWFGGLPELPMRAPPPGPDGDAAAAWRAGWQTRWPRDGASPLLWRPAELLMPRLRGAGERGAGADAERAALSTLFRRHPATPVAVFAQLALAALELERVRGGLVQRRLFEQDALDAAPEAA